MPRLAGPDHSSVWLGVESVKRKAGAGGVRRAGPAVVPP